MEFGCVREPKASWSWQGPDVVPGRTWTESGTSFACVAHCANCLGGGCAGQCNERDALVLQKTRNVTVLVYLAAAGLAAECLGLGGSGSRACRSCTTMGLSGIVRHWRDINATLVRPCVLLAACADPLNSSIHSTICLSIHPSTYFALSFCPLGCAAFCALRNLATYIGNPRSTRRLRRAAH